MENSNNNIGNSDYFIIPNPIYDVVFRYLMEDSESAKIVLSTLINEKIVSLDFEPISHTQKVKDPETDKEIKLFHLDFTAVVELADGTTETVMIELQKAKLASDIFRFKRYICSNFQKMKEYEVINPHTQAVDIVKKPIRLIPVFILNFRIENEINDLVIRTNRIKRGVFKGKRLKRNNEFIDHLTYDMIVVQLPNLSTILDEEFKKDAYRTKIYFLLLLFDQGSQTSDNHRLKLTKQSFPNFLNRVIQRLQSADSNNPDLEEQMNVEDEYLSELMKRDNEINYFKQRVEQEKQRVEQEKQRAEQEKQRAEQEKQKAEQEKQRADVNSEVILNLARMLRESGTSIEIIQEKTKLSKTQIEKL